MTKIIFLPHEEICPDGAVIDAEPGVTICDAALASGAQYVSTDVYADVGRGFVVGLPDGAVVRCSPVVASELCVDAELVE